jgi:hypothetical protein
MAITMRIHNSAGMDLCAPSQGKVMDEKKLIQGVFQRIYRPILLEIAPVKQYFTPREILPNPSDLVWN